MVEVKPASNSESAQEVLNGNPDILEMKYIGEGDWEPYFDQDGVKEILDFVAGAGDISGALEQHVAENVGDDRNRQTSLATFGVACLKLFLQENWTGPSLDVDSVGRLGQLLKAKEQSDAALNQLEKDADELYPLVRYPVLLLIANVILLKMAGRLEGFVLLPIWSVKCLAGYLSVLEETKGSHYDILKEILERVHSSDALKNFSNTLKAEFYLDCSHLYLRFYEYEKCKDCLDKVKEILKIALSLTASLGKRTKFQQKDLPQMRLDVQIQEKRGETKTKGDVTKDLPVDVELEEETLLPNIKFVDGDSIQNVDLSPIDQAYAIASCVFLQKSKPRDALTHEQVLPFVTTVLMSPQAWSVQHKALFIRCVVEFSNSRKAERALSQLESLIASFEKKTPKSFDRLRYLQAVDSQPRWVTQRTNAQLLYSIGCVDSALEMFLRLHLWDDVIACYQRLGKHGKAESVIREQLSRRETATLWNLLGDATMEKQYYEKAWEFSKQRNARSQRSMGFYHLRKQEFAESIPYFQKSLELNYLQPGVGFSLGCACMKTNDLTGAVKAFQQSVTLEPDNPEAWNNLASNFIRLNQLTKAYKALQEATRLSYDNWKIWENFLLVCTDIGAFEDSINCMHRLVDLRRKEIDVQVLVILTEAILQGEVDFRNISASRLKPKLFKMFGHITSQITHNPSVWELYAKLYLSNDNIKDTETALQYLYKSHRCYTQNTAWEKSLQSVPAVINVTNQMFEITQKVCGCSDYEARAVALYSTTKMCVSNLIMRLKKAFTNETNELMDEVKSHIDRLENYKKEVQQLIDKLS